VDIFPGLIARKVEALEFKLGYGQYYAPAIKTYFESFIRQFTAALDRRR
jgi:hypothetical protein